MKKLILAAAGACAAAAAYKLSHPLKAHAWASESHTELTSAALELMDKEKKQKQYAFFKQFEAKLLEGCVDPDKKGDPDKAPGTHYYSVANHKGRALSFKNGYYANRFGDFARSARTSAEENYTAAVLLYKNDRIEDAMYVLGRAVHFIEDIGCPVHTASMHYLPKQNNPHYAFEKHANNIIGKYRPEKFDKRLIKSWSGEGFENPLNKLAAASNKHAPMVAALDPLAFEGAVKDMAPVTAQNVMALLLRFYDDCRGDAGFMLSDGKRYAFKNEETGLMLTVGAKGLTLEPADKDKEQKLTFELGKQGSFAFKTAEGGHVAGSLKGYEYPKRDTEPSQFRFFPLGKGVWRISIKAQGYGKVLSCSKAGALAAADFVPGDKRSMWKIIG